MKGRFKMKKIVLFIMALILVVGFTGCEIKYKNNTSIDFDKDNSHIEILDDLIEETDSIKEDIQELDLKIDFGVGELSVEGGAEELIETNFKYNVDRLKPEVTKEVDKEKVAVRIKQPSTSLNIGDQISDLFSGKSFRNEWEIKIKDDTKLNLKIENGVGESKIDLKEVQLESLDIDCGVGDLRVDLANDYGKDLDVTIEGGVGDIRIYVPKDMGVQVKATKGIGDLDIDGFIKYDDIYRNRKYEEGEPIMKIKIDMGVGSIKVIEE